jgi:glycerate dehydrogenase
MRKVVKIVVLDGWTLNPGDLSWAALGECGQLTVYDRTAENQVVERCMEAEVVLTNKTPLTAATFDSLPALQYVGVLATGCNVVDLKAAARRGIPVCNAASYSNASVAQMVFGFLLHFAHQIALHSQSVHAGEWGRCEDFCYWKAEQVELEGKTLGIYGLGQIGERVARLGLAFGMRIIAYTRDPSRPAPGGVEWVDRERLFKESDYLSLHCPLTEETHHLINARHLSLMKPGAVLINTGRGGLVDEVALAESLQSGHLGGAGLDVLDREPPRYPCPLVGVQNCVITPHVAWASRASRQRLMDITVANLRAWQAGGLRNDVTASLR